MGLFGLCRGLWQGLVPGLGERLLIKQGPALKALKGRAGRYAMWYVVWSPPVVAEEEILWTVSIGKMIVMSSFVCSGWYGQSLGMILTSALVPHTLRHPSGKASRYRVRHGHRSSNVEAPMGMV